MSLITIGADPEVFLKKGDAFISAHNILVGDKTNPAKVPYGAIQVDGVAAEFNIDPANSKEEFVRNIKEVYAFMDAFVKSVDPEVSLHAIPSVDFEIAYFNKLPFDVKRLGCNPDFNAWAFGSENPAPSGENVFFRTGSGHLHIGAKSALRFRDSIVRLFDLFLGLLQPLWDSDTRRRDLYGKPGAYRPKNYGFEYRTLSNAWLNSDDLIAFVYERAIEIMGIAESFRTYHESLQFLEDATKSISKIFAGKVASEHLSNPEKYIIRGSPSFEKYLEYSKTLGFKTPGFLL